MTCPIEAVFGPDDRHPCTLLRGHDGQHSYLRPAARAAAGVNAVWQSTFRRDAEEETMTYHASACAAVHPLNEADCTCGGKAPAERNEIPGWEGSLGPFPSEYGKPHVYARNVHSGAGNCVCGLWLGHVRHVAAAPGVPIPERMRP